MQDTSDEPPFRPGDWIQGRPKTRASKVLKQQFSANRIVLGRECKLVNGQWVLFGRPTHEFSIVSRYSREKLRRNLERTWRVFYHMLGEQGVRHSYQ